MPRHLDHIDLRVPDLAAVTPFYQALLPALGFTQMMKVENWLQFCAEGDGATEFFGLTESPEHRPNENRIAFWADSPAAVDRLALLLPSLGARHIEGPGYDEGPGYYAVFFEDPAGNRLEICHRRQND